MDLPRDRGVHGLPVRDRAAEAAAHGRGRLLIGAPSAALSDDRRERRKSARAPRTKRGRALFPFLGALFLLATTAAACGDRDGGPAGEPEEDRPVPEAEEPPFPDLSTPDPGALVEVPAFGEAPGRALRLFLDAGHGADKNPGNTSAYGVAEQDFTIDLAIDLEEALIATGAFDVRQSRGAGELAPYSARVAAAAAMGADAFVSLHSDVRGSIRAWSPVPGLTTRASLDAPGFSVLFSDEGGPALAGRRRALAVSVAREMSAAGFFPYPGQEYEGLYAAEPEAAGAFVDRHADSKRILVLRRTAMPAVIVETHNALDPREAARWDEAHTRQAFAMALARGLREALGLELARRLR